MKVRTMLSCPPAPPPQTMTDVVGNPEEERRAEFYFQPWAQEAVCRYFYSKVGAVPGPPKGGDTRQDEWCRLAASLWYLQLASPFSLQVQQRRQELEQALGIRNT